MTPREQEGFIEAFEQRYDMPDDVAEAFEQFKLVVMRHRAQGWQSISADQMGCVLYALMQLCWDEKQPIKA